MPGSDEFLTHRRKGTSTTAGVQQGTGDLGDLAFAASAGHSTVITYEARVRAEGSSTVLVTKNLGKPTPFNNVIVCNIKAILQALPSGNYTVTVAAIGPGGTDDSTQNVAYTVPLVAA